MHAFPKNFLLALGFSLLLISCSEEEKKDEATLTKENLAMNKKVKTCNYLTEEIIQENFPEAKEIEIRHIGEKYPSCRCEFKIEEETFIGRLTLRIGMQDKNSLSSSARKFGKMNNRKRENNLGENAYYFGGAYSLYMVLANESILNIQLQNIKKNQLATGKISSSKKDISLKFAQSITDNFIANTRTN